MTFVVSGKPPAQSLAEMTVHISLDHLFKISVSNQSNFRILYGWGDAFRDTLPPSKLESTTHLGGSTMNRPTILLADDHTMIADAFRVLLEPQYQIVAMVYDGRTLIDKALELKPDVVVVDVGMPLLNGLSAGQQLKQRLRKVKLIYVTMNEDPDLASEALRTGASAYLLKSSAASELLKSVHEVLRGGTYITPKIKRLMEDSFIRSSRPSTVEKRLTPRQVEVLQLLAEGKTMKEVGSVLSLTARTVAFHKYRIMEVLKFRSNAELVQFAVKNNIVTTPDAMAMTKIHSQAAAAVISVDPGTRSA
jgi:DNA-binding NarL/FixJ family response regulator